MATVIASSSCSCQNACAFCQTYLVFGVNNVLLFNNVSGSPAEKADLEVADEILEINGQSLENSTHTDVIAHIHNVRQYNRNI